MIQRFGEMSGVTAMDAERRGEVRDDVEGLLEMARHLPRRERLLVEQVVRHGSSVTEAAEIFGEREPVVRRRFKRLCARVREAEFVMLTEMRERVPAELVRTGDEVFVAGKSLRSAAAAMGVTLHRVRRDVAEIRALVRGLGLGLSPRGGLSERRVGPGEAARLGIGRLDHAHRGRRYM
ncbi:hypothetical protein [Poriferisphaera sp. WC338]|uniref:hypothetical protein n=1 Tax=Poriferisphaera sp. WC338 TaxID=3425129 RepID=UPI003D814E84